MNELVQLRLMLREQAKFIGELSERISDLETLVEALFVTIREIKDGEEKHT